MKTVGKLSLILGLFLLPAFAFAGNYNKNKVITDSDYRNSNAMGTSSIQSFLERKGSDLANITVDAYGKARTVSEVFYLAGKKYGVSQKLLLVTAQKEQSAITDSSLSDSQKRKLMGYGVFGSNDYSSLAGIANQIDAAAWQFNRYYERPNNYNYKKGVTKTANDGITVKPDNKATAALYNYTPYAGAESGTPSGDKGNGGNFLFWKTWYNWFLASHPDGTLVREEGTPGVYFLQNGKKRPFWLREVFSENKFKLEEVVEVSRDEIEKYPTGVPVKFPDGTLLKAPWGGIYILENGKKRGITSREVFLSLGYKFENAVPVSKETLRLYPSGNDINNNNAKITNGTLIRSPLNGGIYLIDDNKKRPIAHRQIFENQFHWEHVVNISKEKFRSYRTGNPVLFKDGTLIADESGNVFLIDGGSRRHITSPSVFNGLGYQSHNIVKCSNYVVLLHPGGAPINSY